METIRETLTRAYQIVKASRHSFSPEMTGIQCMFLSRDAILAFDDDDLFLEFIQRIIDEKDNISFPEDPSLYRRFFEDCILLKNQMKSRPSFDEDSWLSYVIHLLEALKTPYYPAFSCVILTLHPCFQDKELFDATWKCFYSVIIRSTPEKLDQICEIVNHAPFYQTCSFLSEEVLSGILTDTLAIFGNDKEYWLPFSGSLSDFFQLEEEFLNQLSPEEAARWTLPDYLSNRTLWFSSRKNITAETWKEGLFSHPNPVHSQSVFGQRITDSHFLETCASDLSSIKYITNPAIGREQEISDLELILISPKKSPILIGEAGVGKTSVVEGLSWLLQKNDVPDLLKGKKIYKLTTTSLLSGTKYVGEMEERMRQLISELESHPEIILFIDEIHTIVGAGSTESSHNDISNMLKPCIDRGEIKIIGATTKEEYQRFLLPDRALARRFYPISVEEPDEALTLSILLGTIPSIEYETKVRNAFDRDMTEKILHSLIAVSRRENQPEHQMTRLPELPLSLLEMAFSYAALYNRKSLSIEDIHLAVRHSSRLKKEVRSTYSCLS